MILKIGALTVLGRYDIILATTHKSRDLRIISKMLKTTSECLLEYGNYYRLAQATQSGELRKVTHGVYSDGRRYRDVEVLQKIYPMSVVTMLSAYYYYGLTDNVPDKIHLSVERNGTKIKDSNVVQYFVPKMTGMLGVVNEELHGMNLRIFDKERLLIETVRHKTKMPLDLYREVIGSFRKIVHILYPAKMQDYIEMFPKKNVIFETIKNEVF